MTTSCRVNLSGCSNHKYGHLVGPLGPNIVLLTIHKSPGIHTYNTLKHSTSLTLIISPTSVHPKGTYSVSGTLIDTVTSTALASKTITFTATSPITISSHVTNTAGQYS